MNADVGIDAEDRRGLERLLRYCARPAFADNQIKINNNGAITFTMAKASPKGETQLTLKPDEFLGKIAQLVPKPRKHRHRYHGALAANSPFRKHIIRYADKPLPATLGENSNKKMLKKKIKKRIAKVRFSWAQLITRLYELMPLICPHCESEMKIIAFIKDTNTIKKILDHIGKPTDAPQFERSRGPPEMYDGLTTESDDFYFDPILDDVIDQTVSW